MIRYEENTAAAPSAEPGIVRKMADSMLEMGMNSVPVTAQSLAEHTGFTRAEIEKHGADAADLAKSLAVTRRDRAA